MWHTVGSERREVLQKIWSGVEDEILPVKVEMDGTKANLTQIKSALSKRMDVEMISGKDVRDFKIKKTDMGYTVHAKYDSKSRYVANIYLLVEYDKSVEIMQ